MFHVKTYLMKYLSRILNYKTMIALLIKQFKKRLSNTLHDIPFVKNGE